MENIYNYKSKNGNYNRLIEYWEMFSTKIHYLIIFNPKKKK